MASNVKVEPSEPWRYLCPRCESTLVYRLVGGEKVKGKQYPTGGRGARAVKQDEKKKYRCKACDSRLGSVIDKKTNDTTKP
jgi:ribosomal protein L37AE/L43A